jgi:hypothetical protein
MNQSTQNKKKKRGIQGNKMEVLTSKMTKEPPKRMDEPQGEHEVPELCSAPVALVVRI